jgi:hypothetical protein
LQIEHERGSACSAPRFLAGLGGASRDTVTCSVFTREVMVVRFRIGDEVVRRHRALKTHGEIVRLSDRTRDGIRLLWVKWNHPETLPNPSLEMEDSLELVTTADQATLQG